MTTINVSDELKRKLLKIAAGLQAARGEKVDYDEVLRYLIKKATRNLALFRQACSPTRVSTLELQKEAKRGREEDRRKERNLEQRYS